MHNSEIFEVVLTTKAKAKNSVSQILIETSIKGLLYRSEVYMDEHMIDAVEVNCSDISTVDQFEEVFQARYLAAHKRFEELYTQERIFVRVLSTDGDYKEGEGLISIITSVSDNIVKSEAFLDSTSIDVFQEEIIDGDDEKLFKVKYTQSHKELCQKYILIPKFPANTFINPVIKKMPFYKKSPMYAFVFLLALITLLLWILSIIMCGKAMKKIIAKVAGKEAGMIVKDLQKSMCSAGADGEVTELKGSDGSIVLMTTDADGNTELVQKSSAKAPDFVVLPESVIFKETNQIYPIYIKNNLLTQDVLIVLKDRVIYDFEDALVSPDMVVNVITKEVLHIKGDSVGIFEFKLEGEFLQSKGLEERNYHGSLVFDAINLKTRESTILTVGFDFVVIKDGSPAVPEVIESQKPAVVEEE
jgi:hypothetical protein